jgi:hypothetical protein
MRHKREGNGEKGKRKDTKRTENHKGNNKGTD